MRTGFLVLLAVGLCPVLTSCGGGNKTRIVGKWEGSSKVQGRNVTSTLEFKANGTLAGTEKNEDESFGEHQFNGNYSLPKDDVIKVDLKSGPGKGQRFEWKVAFAGNDEVTLTNTSNQLKRTFKRIK
jgi:hypothetical protein